MCVCVCKNGLFFPLINVNWKDEGIERGGKEHSVPGGEEKIPQSDEVVKDLPH